MPRSLVYGEAGPGADVVSADERRWPDADLAALLRCVEALAFGSASGAAAAASSPGGVATACGAATLFASSAGTLKP